MENITNQQVGARIANVRGEMKMTQAELASEMSVRLGREIRPLTVTRLEGGKRPIGVDELVAVAEVLQVKPADLLTDSLSIGSVRIVGAYQAVVRASNRINDAVRQLVSAQKELHVLLAETKGKEYLERLPAVTRMFVRAASEWTVEHVINEALNEEGDDDDAET